MTSTLTTALRSLARVPGPLALSAALAFAGAAPARVSEGDTDMTDRDHAPASGAGTHAHTNRLAGEKSPYLLQHAHNPVDWYPWGEEALTASREQDKPIFLSVGYSTCHWCHVMERESFENEKIAALMNEHFINIKVDREERPDVDMLYMDAVQAMTGHGGWPMSVWLTPDLEPFYAGTYFPPTASRGMPGFPTILTEIAGAWANDREKLQGAASKVGTALGEHAKMIVQGAGDGELDAGTLETAYRHLVRMYDDEEGGFGSAPKFPMPHYVRYLLRYAERSGEAQAREMALHTLDEMAKGGIHDHLGGGFHRYATDRIWLAPHFEKMLYDQAGLALAYTDAWLATGDDVYRTVSEGILDYVLRDLTHADGGFFAAEDADSEGEEGTFYVWTAGEIDHVLGERSAAFRKAYDVTESGNWEGKNILQGMRRDALAEAALVEDRAKLRAHRAERVRPHRDEKIIVAWNGFMIEAFARAGAVFGEPRYVEAAARAAAFVDTALTRDGRLLRHWRDGAADVSGYLEDYAFYGRGLVALYEATFDPTWVERANAIAAGMVDLFDHESGMLTFYGHDQEQLLTKVIESHDGAMPSGASAAAHFLLRLGHLTADRAREERGDALVDTYAGTASRQPTVLLELMSALDFSLGPKAEVVVAGALDDPTVQAMLRVARDGYRPNTVFAHRPAGEAGAAIRLMPYLEAQAVIGGQPTAYVCRDYACELPVHDPEALAARLAE